MGGSQGLGLGVARALLEEGATVDDLLPLRGGSRGGAGRTARRH